MGAYATPHVVLPSAFGTLMSVYNQQLLPSDRVRYGNENAWLVDPHALRNVQRTWSSERHGPPTKRDAFHLMAQARWLIEETPPPQTWRDRFYLQELALLRTAMAHWLTCRRGQRLNPWCRSTPVFFNPTTHFLGSKLTAAEARITFFTADGLIPILIVNHPEGTSSAAVPWLVITDAWEGAPIAPTIIMPKEVPPLSTVAVIERMWRYLPPIGDGSQHYLPIDLLPLVEAEPGSEMYPDMEQLTRNSGTRRVSWTDDTPGNHLRELQLPHDPVEDPIDITKELDRYLD